MDLSGMSAEELQQMEEYFEHARAELRPMIETSAVALSIWSNRSDPDPKQCMELGYMVMLDKPILILCPAGETLPGKLQRVADKVVFYDPSRPMDTQTSVGAQIQGFVEMQRIREEDDAEHDGH